MHTLLSSIVENKYRETEQLKQKHSLLDYSKSPLFSRDIISLKQALTATDFGIIAEIKRKSPGAGSIKPELDIAEQTLLYLDSGAAAISVLTDFPHFGGSIEDVLQVRQTCQLPVLRKEFIVDELQLFEARANGSDAILLIAAILEQQQAHHLTIIAKSLGMEVVFEIHTLRELDKLNDEVDLLLVNNRNLDTQTTDVNHCLELAPHLPESLPAIAASGIRTREEIEQIRSCGYVGALIGESLLKNNHLNRLTAKSCVH